MTIAHDIAHLVLAHADVHHVTRLVKRLSAFSDVFLHYDSESDDNELLLNLHDLIGHGVYYLQPRRHCAWGGYNAVQCEIELLRFALSTSNYKRLVFLQGADYPIKTDAEIVEFFNRHTATEFIRGCPISASKDKQLYNKSRYFLFINYSNLLTRIANKLTRSLDLKLRDGYIHCGRDAYTVYWGSAQWALTGECAKYVINWHDDHPKYNRWFYYSLTCDETYFVTTVMNSKYASSTLYGRAELEHNELNNWRNLTYFDYSYDPKKRGCKVFTELDVDELLLTNELYARKVNTELSTALLDKLDERNRILS